MLPLDQENTCKIMSNMFMPFLQQLAAFARKWSKTILNTSSQHTIQSLNVISARNNSPQLKL